MAKFRKNRHIIRTSQNVKEFSSLCYVTQIKFLKFDEIMFKLYCNKMKLMNRFLHRLTD